jgi:hypothetical protein
MERDQLVPTHLPEPVRLLTAQAAALANCHRDTLPRWVQAGLLPAPLRVGGRNYWDGGAIKALLGDPAPSDQGRKGNSVIAPGRPTSRPEVHPEDRVCPRD